MQVERDSVRNIDPVARVMIDQIEYCLPDRIVTNDDLKAENPDWDMPSIEKKSGVLRRHICNDNETAFDLSIKAVANIINNKNFDKSKIDTIIYCTQSPDYIMPSNAFLIHKYFDLSEDLLAFDINLACSGYVYGLALVRSLLISKTSTCVLFVTGDTYSKYIHKKDRSARVLFGDGASASIVRVSTSHVGIVDLILSTSGKNFEKFYIPAGGCRMPFSEETAVEVTDQSGNIRSKNNIVMDGLGVWSFIQSTVPKQIGRLLERNGLTVNDIDLYIFHQASKMTLDSLSQTLKLDRNKVYLNLSNTGNTVSSSIPIALKNAQDEGRIVAGSKVLLSGFGVGLSWGSVLMQF